MKVISKSNNRKTYQVNLGLALVFILIYIWRERSIFLLVALVFLALALWRKYVLDKVL